MKNTQMQLLGLNNYELKSYTSLIKLGRSTASIISRESGVPYGRIYDILHSLERKGFVQVIPDQTKNFIASDPKPVLEAIEKSEKEMIQLKEEFNQLSEFYKNQSETVVKIVEGRKNFWKITKELPESEESRYILRYLTNYSPSKAERTKMAIKKGKDVKNLIDINRVNKDDLKKWRKVLPDIRHFDNEGVTMSIVDDKVILIGLIHSNISLLIKDQAFVKLMKKWYLNTHSTSKEV